MIYNRLTIITVCLNAVETIDQTIKSVFKQSYDDVEYIIIDGGSTDGTVDIIKKYSDRLAYWTSEEDCGIYDAMNKGVDHATGDVIGFINANDWYEDNVFESVINSFNQMKCDILYGDLILCGVNTITPYSNKYANLFDFSKHFPIIQPTSFIRASLLKKYPFDNSFKIAGDAKWYWMAHVRKLKFYYFERVVSYFSDGGISSNVTKVLPEWKTAALEVNRFEIERSFQYWKLIDRNLDANFESVLIAVLKKYYGLNIDIVGSGTVFYSLLPYLEKADIRINNIYDDVRKMITYCKKDIVTLTKIDINQMGGDVIFIASEECCDSIAKQINYNPMMQNVVLFPTFFSDVVERYLYTLD